MLRAIHEHRDKLGSRIGLQDQARYTPFEVTQTVVWALVAAGFGEDVDPGVVVGRVRGWSQKRIRAISRVGKLAPPDGRVRAGEEAESLGHGRLIESTTGRVPKSVSREDLAEAKECRCGSKKG
jgi:hypothetical protein